MNINNTTSYSNNNFDKNRQNINNLEMIKKASNQNNKLQFANDEAQKHNVKNQIVSVNEKQEKVMQTEKTLLKSRDNYTRDMGKLKSGSLKIQRDMNHTIQKENNLKEEKRLIESLRKQEQLIKEQERAINEQKRLSNEILIKQQQIQNKKNSEEISLDKTQKKTVKNRNTEKNDTLKDIQSLEKDLKLKQNSTQKIDDESSVQKQLSKDIQSKEDEVRQKKNEISSINQAIEKIEVIKNELIAQKQKLKALEIELQRNESMVELARMNSTKVDLDFEEITDTGIKNKYNMQFIQKIFEDRPLVNDEIKIHTIEENVESIEVVEEVLKKEIITEVIETEIIEETTEYIIEE